VRRTPLHTILGRGWRGRCPRCGEGRLFRRWLQTYERCAACNLVYEPNAGDTIMFIVITDRIPLLFGIAAIYFGFRSSGWPITAAFLAALVVPMLATLRQRQGVALAMVYLSRVWLGERGEV
jgi:uncharacterized protein (DUF983 family)